MAIWYAREMGVEGPVYGQKDGWTGLGVFLDTFDNDQKRDNPSIRAMLNDGTRTYDHDHDGLGGSLGAGCGPVDFRNLQNPFKVRVMYVDGVLSVMYDLSVGAGRTGFEEPKWTSCIAIPATLPTGLHFGVSAATGGLFDEHNVKSFITYSYGDAGVEYQNEQNDVQSKLAEHHAAQENHAQQQEVQREQQMQQAQQTQQQIQQQQQAGQQTAQQAAQNAQQAAQQATVQQDAATEALKRELEDLKRKLSDSTTQAQAHANTQAQQQQAAQAAQTVQTQQQETARSTLGIDASSNSASSADVVHMKQQLTDMERIIAKQSDLIAAIATTAEQMSNRLAAVQNVVNAIQSSASLNNGGGASNNQAGSFLTSFSELKVEIMKTRGAVETEGSNSRGAINSVSQALGPMKTSVDQLANMVNGLRSQQTQYGGQQQQHMNQYEDDSGSWIMWLGILVGCAAFGGLGAYIYKRRRPKRERYMH